MCAFSSGGPSFDDEPAGPLPRHAATPKTPLGRTFFDKGGSPRLKHLKIPERISIRDQRRGFMYDDGPSTPTLDDVPDAFFGGAGSPSRLEGRSSPRRAAGAARSTHVEGWASRGGPL